MGILKCFGHPLIAPRENCESCSDSSRCLSVKKTVGSGESVTKWFKELKSIPKGKSTFEFPQGLKDLLVDHVHGAAIGEIDSRLSDHAAVANKGRLFCKIRDIVQDYKKAHKSVKIPSEFTVLFLAKRIFGRCRQTLYTWKKIWETYGNGVADMTDLTITKLDSLAKLEKDQRDEWLNERRSELAKMDEDAFKVLVRKPVTKKSAPGKLVNGYRVIADRKGTYVRGLQESSAVEQGKLDDFLNTLTPGCETEENVSDASHDVGGASPTPVRPSVVAASPA